MHRNNGFIVKLISIMLSSDGMPYGSQYITGEVITASVQTDITASVQRGLA